LIIDININININIHADRYMHTSAHVPEIIKFLRGPLVKQGVFKEHVLLWLEHLS
jgi:hypothetical protein